MRGNVFFNVGSCRLAVYIPDYQESLFYYARGGECRGGMWCDSRDNYEARRNRSCLIYRYNVAREMFRVRQISAIERCLSL